MSYFSSRHICAAFGVLALAACAKSGGDSGPGTLGPDDSGIVVPPGTDGSTPPPFMIMDGSGFMSEVPLVDVGHARQCMNLQCKQYACEAGGKTTASGTIYDPSGKNPLYNVVVYVPNKPPDAFVDGVACNTCADLYTGDPVASTLSGTDGKFVLENVPIDANVPVVIQIGKWRRQIVIPQVKGCQDNPIPVDHTHLPQDRTQGDMPKIALSTGGADVMECLLLRMGIAHSEFTGKLAGPERVHLLQGATGCGHETAAKLPDSERSDDVLFKLDALKQYDVLLLPCEGHDTGIFATNGGTPVVRTDVQRQAVHDYAGLGGRVFASHFSSAWLTAVPDFQSAAQFTSEGPNCDWGAPPNQLVTIDQSFPKGKALALWMQNFTGPMDNACSATSPGQFCAHEIRHDVDVTATNVGTQGWIHDPMPTQHTTRPMPPDSVGTDYFSFNTPRTSAPDKQCGRVVYTDLHVYAPDQAFRPQSAPLDLTTSPTSFPMECVSSQYPDGWSPQARALEFMLFDLSSCVQPDTVPPQPPPVITIIK